MLKRHAISKVSFFLHNAFIVTLFLASGMCRAEYKLAVINDPDGYTNLRKAPDPKSNIVLRIEQDELFLCEATKGQWWKAKDLFGNKGFIHKSRVVFYKDQRTFREAESQRHLMNMVVDEVTKKGLLKKIPEKEFKGKDGYYKITTDFPKFIPANNFKYASNRFFNINISSKEIYKWSSEIYKDHSFGERFIETEVLILSDNLPDHLLSVFFGTNTREIKQRLSEIFSSSPKISPKTEGYETKRGMALGSTIEDGIKTFGQPLSEEVKQGIEILSWSWSYPMRLENNIDLLEKEQSLRPWRGALNKPENFAFSIRMYFREKKLIGLKYESNFPARYETGEGGC